MMEIPYWVIIVLSTLGILFLLINSRNKRDKDFKARYLLAILPRIYFTAIYIWFWLDTPSPEIRTLWGRSGIVYILAIDLWIMFAEWFDYNWDTKWQFLWASRRSIFRNLPITLKKKWDKIKWKMKSRRL